MSDAIFKNRQWYVWVGCPTCDGPKRLIPRARVRTEGNQCRSCSKRGNKYRGKGDPKEVGYEFKHKDGKISVRQPDGTTKYRHRMIVEAALQRPLEWNEKVRFHDDNPRNLEPSNLYVVRDPNLIKIELPKTTEEIPCNPSAEPSAKSVEESPTN